VGKAASSRNALRHGLAARAVVVLDEDPQDFERFRAELQTALAPRCGLEQVLAETVVHAAWRRRRAARAEAALFNRGPALPELRELMTLVGYEAAADRAFHRALGLLERGRTTPGGTASTPRRPDRRLEIVLCGKGTQSPGAAPVPNPFGVLGALAVRPEPLGFAENRLNAAERPKYYR
jgi:hypothetical protein